jgi:hypothetical protein
VASGWGAHQFQGPSIAIRDGTSSARTTLESMRTASAAARPISLRTTVWQSTSAPTATQKRMAAEVTTRPTRCSPSATASRVESPFRYPSRMRLSRNTP